MDIFYPVKAPAISHMLYSLSLRLQNMKNIDTRQRMTMNVKTLLNLPGNQVALSGTIAPL
jgi:hypothetical protein